MGKQIVNSTTRTVDQQFISSFIRLESYPHGKSEHALHFYEVCPPGLDARSKAATSCVFREMAHDDPTFILRIISGEECWIYGYNQDTKQQW